MNTSKESSRKNTINTPSQSNIVRKVHDANHQTLKKINLENKPTPVRITLIIKNGFQHTQKGRDYQSNTNNTTTFSQPNTVSEVHYSYQALKE